MSEATETTMHGYTCTCPACTGERHDHEEGGATASYVAPTEGGNGDGTIGLQSALDQLIWGDHVDWKEGSSTLPQITYSYAYNTWGFDGGQVANGRVLTDLQKQYNEQAIQMWENVANINLVEANNGDATNIVFRQGDHYNGAAGVAAWRWNQSGTVNKHVDVTYQDDYIVNPYVGSYQFKVLLHEIGHALGLYHAGNYNGAGATGGNTFYDNRDVSLMSYFNGAHTGNGNWPASPMLYDIAAIQAIYGANTNFNSGDNIYTIDGAKTSYCIWDGGGNDTLSAESASAMCVIDLREGQLNVTEVGQTNVWVAFNASIENAKGGSAMDFLYGNLLANTLYGNGGADQITGGSGNDTLEGGAGNDTFRFANGDGNDTINDGEAGDVIAIGNTPVNGTAMLQDDGTYRLTLGNGEVLVLSLAGANLVLTYNNGADTITLKNFDSGDFGIVLEEGQPQQDNLIEGTPNEDILNGTGKRDIIIAKSSDDTVYGGGGNDSISGNDGDDLLYGDSGNDDIDGGKGNDTIYGGSGIDMLNGDTGNDLMYGGNSMDTISGNDGNDTIHGEDGDDTLYGGKGEDEIHGGSGEDFIKGDTGNDVIYGDKSADTIYGGDGDDLIYGGDGHDSIFGGKGNDTIYGDSGNDYLEGDSGGNVIFGGTGNDTIKGESGNDTINGGAGNDVLYGGSGSDVFRFEGDGTIKDFNAAGDKIDFVGMAASMADLTIAQSGAHTTIDIGSTHIIVENWLATDFNVNDFLF